MLAGRAFFNRFLPDGVLFCRTAFAQSSPRVLGSVRRFWPGLCPRLRARDAGRAFPVAPTVDGADLLAGDADSVRIAVAAPADSREGDRLVGFIKFFRCTGNG